MTLRLAVIYYSSTGTVDAMAQRAAQAGEKAGAGAAAACRGERAPGRHRQRRRVARARAGHRGPAQGDQRRHHLGRRGPARLPDALGIASQAQAFLDGLGPGEGRGQGRRQGLRRLHRQPVPTAARSPRCWRSTRRCTTSAASSWRPVTPTPRSSPTATRTARPTSRAPTTAPLEDASLHALDHLVERTLTVAGKARRLTRPEEATTVSAGVETGRITTDIPARMDRLPWARWHWLVVIGLGTVWILDGLGGHHRRRHVGALKPEGTGLGLSRPTSASPAPSTSPGPASAHCSSDISPTASVGRSCSC